MAAASKKSEKKNLKEAPKFNKSSKKPFKAKKKEEQSDAAKSKAAALQLEDEEPAFPRGGGSSLSRRERDEIRAEVDAEFEVEERGLRKKRKSLQKRNQTEEDDLGSLSGGGITGKLPKYANRITLKNITPGMKLWGVVAEVDEKDLVISLPGGLRGLVRASDAVDPVLDNEVQSVADNTLSSIFNVGQLVACVVLNLDNDNRESGKQKIWLSLRLSSLNKGLTLDSIQEGTVLTAYVKSIEDHGYILHFGLPSFTGFLPKNSQNDTKINTGQLLQGIVKSIDRTHKVVYMSSDPDIVSKHVTKDVKGISFDLLIPGMMVDARVLSTLENGVMLSFLTYFTGTVDIFHLQNGFPKTSWRDGYNKNKKVNARILFVDPSSRAIGLTLNTYLVCNKSPPPHVKIGDIYENSKVIRVDRGLGLLLEIPSMPVSTPAYVSISDVAEGEVRKLEKKFKEGSCVRVRILGFRSLEGVATGTLKANAFEGSLFTHSDVTPGMIVKAKIIAVDPFGAIVQFPGGVKAQCPLRHMSELEVPKAGKKFQVGAELAFRVLGGKSKMITVTHKKSLVKSKLPIISSYADATDGLITHGWISKIENHGCFVRFYNGVQGFAPRSELELEAGYDDGPIPSSIYHVGQVVKCRVVSSVPGSRRINLSFMIKPRRVSEDDIIKLGSLVSGVVDRITPNAVVVYVNGKKYLKGTITTEHLADHQGQAVLMKSVLKPGYEFDQLLVLDIESNNYVFSAKHSLIKSAQQLPSELSQISPNSVVHGYICNLIETGCFVRFLGRLTGFSPRNKAMDDHKIDLSEAFYVGQSVRSNILDVNKEMARITLSLKQSSCASTDASLMQDYFLLEEKIAKLQLLDSSESEVNWTEGFNIGCLVEGKIQETKDIGVVVSFDKYNDVLGFITHYQLAGTTVETGSIIQAVVLDISKTEHLVDLSLKAEFIDKVKESSCSQKHKKKRKKGTSKDVELHQTVNAVVEMVKENYLVLSIPKYANALGYASKFDYNSQKFPQKQFLNGQSVVATVMALPSPSTAGRLLLLLNSISESETSSSKRAKKKSSYKVGSLVQAEITEIRPLDLRLKFGVGFHGRIHITEVHDDNVLENPFSNFRVGKTVTARIVGKINHSDNKQKSYRFDLSVKPAVLTGSFEVEDELTTEEFNFSTGQHITGYVYKVDSEWVWLTISRNVRAQLFILDSSCDPGELDDFQMRFPVGKAVTGHVLSANKDKKLLRLVLRPSLSVSDKVSDGEVSKRDEQEVSISNENATAHISEGCVVGGRVSKILPGLGGINVQIGPHTYGRVHFTELTDSWVSDLLSAYHEGQFVKCKVLEISQSVKGTTQIDLSLRSSREGMISQDAKEACKNVRTPTKHVEMIEDLRPDMTVQGYVKNVTPKGCFIVLSRKLDAKILLSNLSDGYVKDPEKEFPLGKLVTGRVLSVEPLSKRVEVTLKTLGASDKSGTSNLSSLHVGDIISGRIKRVETFGLFITINDTNLVGLCHKSELSDDHIDNIETNYRAGKKVRAKILKVDAQRNRISLGMKESYVLDGDDTEETSDEEADDGTIKTNGFMADSKLILLPDRMDVEGASFEIPILAQAESRASVPPLEVTLDDESQGDVNNIVTQNKEHIDEANVLDEKSKRKAKKKAKEEREREIRAAEERLLEKDVPRTGDEFEKLVRGSPNSSFVWIKYMAFALSTADVEKARSIAERALQTINIREENEKLNIWVAYFNLENEYGNPPEEAVQKVFQRALQYNDPKKVHLALLGMYERTEQHRLADELVEKMTKKFKQSCKVWLRRIQRNLNQQQDQVQSVVNRALLSLLKHKHIKFISQTAILEFKCGVPHMGRSMFEGILKEYPKRTDLWSIYLDQEIRLGDRDVIRALFERATCLSLPAKKMKFLFKKYLEYEKSLGDEERIEYVKKKAMDYVESTLA